MQQGRVRGFSKKTGFSNGGDEGCIVGRRSILRGGSNTKNIGVLRFYYNNFFRFF